MEMNKNTKKRSTGSSNIKDVYLFEKALADKIKNADRKERMELYNSVYAEYYQKYPEHPFIQRDENMIRRSATLQLNYLMEFIEPDMVFLELGPGTGALSAEIARHVNTVYALDVSPAVLMNSQLPSNVKVIIYDGIKIPGTIEPVHIVYSNQVMEHLHPDDVIEQLRDISHILTLGGKCICRTPHRYSGPHDTSKHFDSIATCFHLKEYTIMELVKMFKLAGFKKVKYEIVPKGRRVAIPLVVINIIEILFGLLPVQLRRAVSRNLPFKPLFNFYIVGEK